MDDKRTVLNSKEKMMVSDNKTITILNEAGRGANCIVYNALCNDNIGVEHCIRLKECYPYYLDIIRKNDGSLSVSEKDYNSFKDAKESFIKAYKKNIEVKQTMGLINSTINSEEIIIKNNTIYILMTVNEGIDYGKYKDKSLKEVFIYAESLAKIIQKYHENGLLHLDIKPENIFVLPETKEHILLFDFDSVVSKSELKRAGNNELIYTNGFSAPEQIRGEIEKIDYHTDIYSIGALIFYKVFGRVAELKDIGISGKCDFENIVFKSEKYQPKLFRELKAFFKNTLSISVELRCNDVNYIIKCLDRLIYMADTENVKLIDTFQYNMAHFVGRQEEIRILDDELISKNVVFLSGIGGIGKTEIAKQYAKIYRDKYNVIEFAVFEKDIMTLVNEEIYINKIERDEGETEENYFKRKIKVLKQTAEADDLIIIDNFDVEYDKNLELLFDCKCKFIVTTRMDYRDFNYSQINVDRISDEDDILDLFYTYNDIEYTQKDEEYINELIRFVEYHTMTVELIAKYLKRTGEAPRELYNKYLEKNGLANTGDVQIKQRKDKKLNFESVNSHLEILFDISGFDNIEKEILGSLSLFAGIRILKSKFESLCVISEIARRIDDLIKRGWIEYDEVTEKISLHQVIQDIVYRNLSPSVEKCPNITEGISRYALEERGSYQKRKMRRRILKTFMERITGQNLQYAKLCLIYGKDKELEQALRICNESKEAEAFDIMQKIYRKKIENTVNESNINSFDGDFEDYYKNQLENILEMIDKIICSCEKYSTAPDYMAKTLIETGDEIDRLLTDNIYLFVDEIDVRVAELDKIYKKIIEIYERADGLILSACYDTDEKIRLYKIIKDFYMADDCRMEYQNKYFGDIRKAYGYQKIIDELRKTESKDTSDMSITDKNGTTKIWFDDVTFIDMAENYENRGDYENALMFHKKAYENEEELHDEYMSNVAKLYIKRGDAEKAAEVLKKALGNNKKMAGIYGYSGWLCVELIELLLSCGKLKEAEKYARELVYYEKMEIVNENNLLYNSNCNITYITAGIYYLYLLENRKRDKEKLWSECVSYYKKLSSCEIGKEIFDFIQEYIEKENTGGEKFYREVINITDRIDTWQNKKFKESLIRKAIDENKNTKVFRKYHVLLLSKLAEVLLEYDDEGQTADADNVIKQAKEYYLDYGIDDEYIINYLYKVRIRLLFETGEYDNEKVKQLKNKCNYKLLAEYEIKTGIYDRAEKIWQRAAEEYNDIGNYLMEEKCLLNAVNSLACNTGNVTCDKEIQSNDYYEYLGLISKIIDVKIKNKDYKNADYYIMQYYNINKMGFDKKISAGRVNLKRILDYMNMMRKTADYFLKSGQYVYSLRLYFVLIYMGMKCLDNSNEAEIIEEIKRTQAVDYISQPENKQLLKEYGEKILLHDIGNNNETGNDKESDRTRGKIRDLLILLKEDIEAVLDKQEESMEIYDEETTVCERHMVMSDDEEDMCKKIIAKIIGDYEYREIEFKR